jgi:hypothetical protein
VSAVAAPWLASAEAAVVESEKSRCVIGVS